VYLLHFDEAKGISDPISGGDPLIRFSVVMTMLNVMLARVYFLFHYVSDTLIGMALGMLIGFVIFSV
jgi:membrane-associated phospholipid phosphatase